MLVKIVQSGTTAEIFNQPDSEFVANFVGTESILEGTVKSSKRRIDGDYRCRKDY